VDESFRPTGSTVPATVVRVVDGDTIIVRIGGRDERLRYIGMDTPETVKPDSPVEWMGPEASRANAALVEGRTVELEKDVSETDQYGRLLRYVWLVTGDRWTLVNLELVRRGYAQVETDPPDVRYADRFIAAERAAREAGLGLWGSAPSGP
jgi:micrococcal nuclease